MLQSNILRVVVLYRAIRNLPKQNKLHQTLQSNEEHIIFNRFIFVQFEHTQHSTSTRCPTYRLTHRALALRAARVHNNFVCFTLVIFLYGLNDCGFDCMPVAWLRRKMAYSKCVRSLEPFPPLSHSVMIAINRSSEIICLISNSG